MSDPQKWGQHQTMQADGPESTTLDLVRAEVMRSRSKYPGNREMLRALRGEVDELEEALLSGKRIDVEIEARQVAAVAIRILEEGDATPPTPLTEGGVLLCKKSGRTVGVWGIDYASARASRAEIHAGATPSPPAPEPVAEPCDECGGSRVIACRADRDGECAWKGCPQTRDSEPKKSGRHCPRDAWAGRDEDKQVALLPCPKCMPAPEPQPLTPEETAELIASAPGHLGLTPETAAMMQAWRESTQAKSRPWGPAAPMVDVHLDRASYAARRAAGEPGHGMAEPWTPTVGARVVTAAKLTAADLFDPFRARKASAEGRCLEHDPIAGMWVVAHDDDTEAPYDADELSPAPEAAK